MLKKINIASIILISLFTLITILTLTKQTDEVNRFLQSLIQSLETPFLTVFLKIISNLSEWFIYIPVAILLIIIPDLRWKFGIPAAITLTVSAALNALLKNIFAVPRPDVNRLIEITGFGFPSGHAMNSAAFIGIITLLFICRSSEKSHRITASVLAVLFILAIGFSRIYLGVHSPADVIAGYAMGLFLSLCALICTLRATLKIAS